MATDITPGLPSKERRCMGCILLPLMMLAQQLYAIAAIKYGAVNNPEAHNLIMSLG